MSNPTNINTGGGTSVAGDVEAARDFVGRDQINIAMHLKDVNDAAQVTGAIAAALGKGDPESESIRADFLSLMKELRRTHSTIVKAVRPLRRVKDDANTFANDFAAVYNDFRDLYDAADFGEQRTRCHKIREIGMRLEKHRAPIIQTPEWGELRRDLEALYWSDMDLIDAHFRPFMKHFNDVMVEIHQDIDQQAIGKAITLKKAFLDALTPQYDDIKEKLRQMTDTIADIELSLA